LNMPFMKFAMRCASHRSSESNRQHRGGGCCRHGKAVPFHKFACAVSGAGRVSEYRLVVQIALDP
jgi:hypothetical protein